MGIGETIFWRGKPKKSVFIASRVLTLMPIAIVWLCLDSTLIVSAFHSDGPWFLIPFMLLHLAPVWIWLGSMLTAGKRWKNTTYYVTNRRIILQGGFFAVNETSIFYKDLHNAQLQIGLLGKLFHTGNIMFNSGAVQTRQEINNRGPVMENLENPQDVYNRIQTIILDIQTDMEYPNAFRPAANPGYQTDYHTSQNE